MDMCRFRGLEDVEYKKVAAALRHMIDSLPEKRTPHTRPLLTKEKRQQLQDSLAFDQIGTRYTNIKKAHARTCKWLKEKNEYLDWLDPSKLPEHHGFFWIKGNPGTGKSTLMKFAVDQAKRTMEGKVILSFFFNARGEELERSTVGMYRSLLSQLLQHIAGLDAIFDSLALTVRPQGGQIQWNIDLLEDLLEEAIQNLGQSPVVCFIDALDECNEDQIRDMVSFFQRIGDLAINVRFQVCFSSRHYPNITIAHGLQLVLEGQEGHGQDITNYVDSELRIGHSKVAEKIRDELKTKASGVFMWVVLVVDILNKEHDRGRMHSLGKRLREIPAGLHDLFRDILTRDARNRDELILCIQWVLFAKEPLGPEELYFAILAGASDEPLEPWNQELITPATIQLFIVDSSKGLTETTKSKTPRVQFIHESVRDFLLKGNGLGDIWPDLRDQFRGQSHEQLKKCCLKYIRADFTGSLQLPHQLPKGPAMMRLVYENEPSSLSPSSNTPSIAFYITQDEAESWGLLKTASYRAFPCRSGFYLYQLFERYEARHRTLKANLLHQAAEDGYLAVAKVLLETGADKDAQDNAMRTPLHLAARNGHLAIAKLLVEMSVDTNSKDNAGRMPLHHAAQNGHLAIAKLLIERSTDKDVQDKEGRTPLSWAIDNRTGTALDMAKLLIKGGRQHRIRDKHGVTPLSQTITYHYLGQSARHSKTVD